MTLPSPDNSGYAGAQSLSSSTSDFNATMFIIRMALGQVSTAALVRVETTSDGLVNVLPLVNQVNGSGEPTPHVTLYGLPVFRLQGGASALIVDPQPGDIGLAIFASRDISSVKASRGVANPGSARQFDMADGIYLGGLLNEDPEQFLRLAGGMTAQTPALDVSGNLSAGSGATGVFGTTTGQLVTVTQGIITNIE